YGDTWEDILEELNEFGLKLAKRIEKTRKTKLMTLGLDVGIDPEGNLFIFEANSAPGVSTIKSEVALTRADYYKYLLDNILKTSLMRCLFYAQKQQEQLNKELIK